MTQDLLAHSAGLSHTLHDIFPSYESIEGFTVYNIFEYAWEGWRLYVNACAQSSARTLILGINPGPHGMVQTGVPFGTVSAVAQYIKIAPAVAQPAKIHPSRAVYGMRCKREEASGTLLWGTIRSLFPNPYDFFSRCFVLNYCPLAFFSPKGENMTPDKLEKHSRAAVEDACRVHLLSYIENLKITKILSVGRYSYAQALRIVLSANTAVSKNDVTYISHPSPLNRNRKTFAPELMRALKN